MAVHPTSHLLKKLRALMQTTSSGAIHAYIVPSEDAHYNEYIAECDMRRQFISKFTGSAGTAIITTDKAALWTDGRYHLQASKELDPTCWTLMKAGLPETPTQAEWLKDNLNAGNKVGVDPFLMDHNAWKKLSNELKTSGVSLVSVAENLIDLVWEDTSVLLPSDKARPPAPKSEKIFKLDTDITGRDWTLKVEDLREEMKKKKCEALLVTALDDIAWLLNLRGSDIDYNPVFFAYCIVTMTDVLLFIEEAKLTPEVEESIRAVRKPPTGDSSSEEPFVRILPYGDILDFIKKKLAPGLTDFIWISNKASEALVSAVPKNKRYLYASPVTKFKARKNPVEIENMRNCHIRDAAALCEYLCWLEKTIEANPNGHSSLWEIQAADYLENCRSQQKHFVGLSFPSMSASGSNGAMIHYKPTEETRRPIGKSEIYLIDSGAQYLDGTTDVTRTLHFGTPTKKEVECFTRVLKGNIRLSMAVFPRLIKANQLDALAREPLWSQGLDYLHGTGHGVGMFLNVHEGPSSISPVGSADDPGLEVGQILSIEPGYYEDGAFGMRIENLAVTQPAETPYNFNDRGYLRFETLTLVPIQLKLIDTSLLTNEELAWLNNYHATVRRLVGGYLEQLGKHEVKKWVEKETQELTR